MATFKAFAKYSEPPKIPAGFKDLMLMKYPKNYHDKHTLIDKNPWKSIYLPLKTYN